MSEKENDLENTAQGMNQENIDSQTGETTEEQSLIKENEELKIQLAETKDKFLRLYAEFDNFKKRTTKEKFDFMTTAAQDTMTALLPVLDDFDRAKEAAEDDHSTEQFSEGVTLVYNKLNSILVAKGLEVMDSTGEVFDADVFEAITEIPAPTDDMKGKVVNTVEKGYKLKGKIIRHPKVVVGK